MSTAKQRALDLLRERQKEFHVFKTGNVQIDYFLKLYKKRFPDQDWSKCCVEINLPDGDAFSKVYAMKPFVRWGPADSTVIERELKTKAPAWLHEFYSEIECAALCFLGDVEILSPLKIVEAEMERREIVCEDEKGSRLILFAEESGSGYGFFAYQSREGAWRVVFGVSRGTDTAEVDEDAWKVEIGDSDIFEWLERMLATDAYPLIKGYERFERCYAEKVGVLKLPPPHHDATKPSLA